MKENKKQTNQKKTEKKKIKHSATILTVFHTLYCSYSTAQNQHTLKQVDPENGVTVVFHVLLESNLKMEDESLHIRAGARDLGEFYINCVDLISVGWVCFVSALLKGSRKNPVSMVDI